MQLITDPRPAPLLPNAVLGMSLFVIAEIMFFAGLISAFTIVKAGSPGSWPPPGQPRLPVGETLVNTGALLLSGAALFWARQAFHRRRDDAVRPLAVAIALGSFFVVFQGVEWVSLLGQGLTLTTSSYGSFFYLIVGVHALHAVAALIYLAVVCWGLLGGENVRHRFAGAQVFWYFVVGMWPFIYYKVYL
jgi:cytochrome c oxidase subunit 3